MPTYEKGTKGKYQLLVSDKSWNKLKQELKTITRKTTPLSVAERIHKLKEVGRGWLNYFRMPSVTGKLRDLDSWIRTGSAVVAARMEEARTQKEKPVTIGCRPTTRLYMEQNKNGRMGCSTKPDIGNNYYFGKTKKARL